LATTGLHGPVNLVSPNPVTNAEFAATLGRVLSRPALVPVPALALELAYGEMARATILAGQRVLPKALLRTEFQFAHPTLDQALRFELGAQ
jgi:NAD dependent epimerase/dehydratase family enzyme